MAQTAGNIPIFQFEIFYNLNLEIAPGALAPITPINGPVFCNAGIWAGSSTVIFNSTVQAVGPVNTTTVDPFCTNHTGLGSPVFTLAGQPVSGVSPVSVSIFDSTNLEAMLDLPPTTYAMGTPAAYSTNGQAYLANCVDLFITNSAQGTNLGGMTPGGTNIVIYFQDSTAGPYLQPIACDYYILTNRTTHLLSITNYFFPTPSSYIVFAGYSFLTNAAFYDWREGWNSGAGPAKKVEALQIDIAKFNTWLTNTAVNGGSFYNQQNFLHKGHLINTIYVYNSVPLTGTGLPAVRVVNGQKLPSSGLTIATPMPVYIKGDYNVQTNGGIPVLGTTNTASTYPAAIMADAITILSPNWNDSITTKLPTPGNTTVNAAMLAGIVPSNPGIFDDYSGGVENFFRLLENWSGTNLTYNGSFVALFPSRYATNHWQFNGYYYSMPTRHWAFDTNFNQADKLPPLTPLVLNPNSVPKINAQPQSQTVIKGQTAHLVFGATGVPALSCQWYFNGTNLFGATNFSLTLTNVQINQAGNYAVKATNVLGSILSSNAALTVVTQPTISVQPASQNALVNSNVLFTVIATGTPPLSYQWQHDSMKLADETNATLRLNNVTMNQAGAYSITVTNLAGGITSSNAILTVFPSAVAMLNGLSLFEGNLIQFDIAGVPGFNYSVQASTNLVDWLSLITNASPFRFTDTNSPDFLQRFYRATYLP